MIDISEQLVALLILGTFLSCTQKDLSKRSFEIPAEFNVLNADFQNYFRECNTSGSIIIFDQNKQQYISNDTIAIRKATVPASTFKILNLLIALETEVIQDEKEVVKWPGSIDTDKYGFRKNIWKDMTVEEAFKESAGWVFVELAKRVGRETYRHYLELCNYGNQDLSEEDIDFWNFGAMGISPLNQIKFIKDVYNENLPFSKRNFNILKKVMLTEETSNYKIRSKTGWSGRDVGLNIGWWVGYIESTNNVVFFATRLIQERMNTTNDFGDCRKSITMNIIAE